ncbi:alpha/beta hydrolase [Bacillus cereus]|nr:alpha/beta hydrolase [Bacillus cereus]PGU65070.1 alpha/beta hydrolase [Bacillus cereus]
MFTSITYLQSGNDKQQKVYDVLNELNIMEDLALYSPVLCGTIPIRIDTPQSDLDIVMEVHNFDTFEQEMRFLYSSYEGFEIKKRKMKNTASIKVNFEFEGFKFKLFAQPKPVRNQNAYKHMIVEHMLLMQHPHIREEVIYLKEKGLKTESAFAQVLKIDGDPYEGLILLGKEMRLW